MVNMSVEVWKEYDIEIGKDGELTLVFRIENDEGMSVGDLRVVLPDVIDYFERTVGMIDEAMRMAQEETG